jgi:hypothetical protein
MSELPLVIALDGELPDMGLSKNGRKHWSERQRLFRESKNLIYMLILEQLGGERRPTFSKLGITFHYNFGTAHRRDPDNILGAYAPWTDAIVALGLVEDDNDRHVKWIMAVPDPERASIGTTIELQEATYPSKG